MHVPNHDNAKTLNRELQTLPTPYVEYLFDKYRNLYIINYYLKYTILIYNYPYLISFDLL